MTVSFVWVRRDLVLVLAFIVPFGLAGPSGIRRDAFVGVLLATSLLAASGLLWWLYYGTPVPLSAVIKTSLTPYADTAVTTYSYGNVPELFLMIRENLVTLIFASYFVARRGALNIPIDLALILGTLLFLAFELVGNRLPVAGGDARFLMPALPILLWYGIRGFHDAICDLARGSPDSYRPVGAFAMSVILMTSVVQLPPIIRRVTPLLMAALREPVRSDRDAILANAEVQRKWPILDTLLTAQTEKCSIADTEVGAIGVLPASRLIFDMSGLNNAALALRRNDPAGYLIETRPDIIWYKRVDWYWGVDLGSDPRLTNEYAFHPQQGIAVRVDSPCRPAVEKALDQLAAADIGRLGHATGAPF
jgi:hypothetical protein